MEKKYEWKDHVIFMGLLLALAVWVNHGIQIKGLYMDDLYFWSCYGEQSFFEYVFPMGSTRFRFLYYLAAWLEMAVVRNHVALFVPINILLNAALSWYLYSIAWRLSRAKAIGFFTGAMFLASRMAYYQIGQVLGLMETMALWMAISILWNLYRYVNEENREKCFYIASLLYFGVCFVHERYMTLLPLLLLALLLKQCKKISLWLSTIVSFGLVQLIRAFTIGSVLPAGTGGTQVADTLNILQAIKFAFSQAAYVFGINAGPEHLNGCPWSESPMWVKGLIGMADGMLLIMVLAFLVKFIMENLMSEGTPQIFNAFFRQIALLWIFGIAHNMDVRMVTFVMKSTIPNQIFRFDPHFFCHCQRFLRDQISPHLCIIIAQSLGILSFQRNHKVPDASLIFRCFLLDFTQINLFIFVIPQGMPLLCELCPRAFG